MHVNNDPFSIHNGDRCSYQVNIVSAELHYDFIGDENAYYSIIGFTQNGTRLPLNIKCPVNLCEQSIMAGDNLWFQLKVQPDYSILCLKVNL